MISENIMMLLTNKIFLSCIISMGFVQVLKTVIKLVRTKRLDLKRLWETGGMPSSHAAIATALPLSSFLLEGISTVSLVALFLSLIIIRDAFGLRREVGKHAEKLNKLDKSSSTHQKFNELSGHTPLEVMMGIAAGALITSLIFVF